MTKMNDSSPQVLASMARRQSSGGARSWPRSSRHGAKEFSARLLDDLNYVSLIKGGAVTTLLHSYTAS
jgi:hypothetical protein